MNFIRLVAAFFVFSASCSVLRADSCWFATESYCDDQIGGGCDESSCQSSGDICGFDAYSSGEVYYELEYHRDDQDVGSGGSYDEGGGHTVNCGGSALCTCDWVGVDAEGNNVYSCTPGAPGSIERWSSALTTPCPDVEGGGEGGSD